MKPFYSKKGNKFVIVFKKGKKKFTRTLPRAELLWKKWDTLKKALNSKEK